MMASIIVVSGDQKGHYCPLGKRTTVIGRDEVLPFQILDDKVSRKHLQIRFDPQTQHYILSDMNSKHGTLINGQEVLEERTLVDNDYITIGQTHLMFTNKDFDTKESALNHYKKVGERSRPTEAAK
jgi:pSer/pThr/pTyr-binding forkhead associated (FHA) protein